MREWLRNRRTDKKMTQEDVAKLANIDRAYYTMIENGTRNPSVKVAKRIALALGFIWTIFFEDQSVETTLSSNDYTKETPEGVVENAVKTGTD